MKKIRKKTECDQANTAKIQNDSIYEDIGEQIRKKKSTVREIRNPLSPYTFTPEIKAKREEHARHLDGEIEKLKLDLEAAERAKTETDEAYASCNSKLKRTKEEIDALKTRLDKSVLIPEGTDIEALQTEMAKLEGSIQAETDYISSLSVTLNIAVESQEAADTEIKEIHNNLDGCFTVETDEEKSRLVAQLNEMKQATRNVAKDAVQSAFGEKADAEKDYKAASAALSEIKGEISDLEFTIDNFETDDAIVHLGGGLITIRYLDSGKNESVHIVGPAEVDPLHHLITIKSKLGSALLGHKVGDVVVVKGRRKEYKVEIIDIDPHL